MNTVYFDWDATRLGSDDIIFQYCEVENEDGDGIYLDRSENPLFEYNQITFTGTCSTTNSRNGIKFNSTDTDQSTMGILRHNTIQGWSHCAIIVKEFVDMYVYGNWTDCVGYPYGRALVTGNGNNSTVHAYLNAFMQHRAKNQIYGNDYIFSNVFNEHWNCCQAVAGDCVAVYDGCAGKCNNATSRCTGQALDILTGDDQGIIGNSFIDISETAIYVSSDGGVSGVIARNNMGYQCGNSNLPGDTPPGSFWDEFDYSTATYDDSQTGNVWYDNLFYHDVRSGGDDWYYDVELTLAEFNANPDPNIDTERNDEDNPLMVDPDNQDFRYTNRSPCIDAAVSLSGPSDTYLNETLGIDFSVAFSPKTKFTSPEEFHATWAYVDRDEIGWDQGAIAYTVLPLTTVHVAKMRGR